MSEEEKKKRRKLQKVSFILNCCELDTSLLTKSTVSCTNTFTIDKTLTSQQYLCYLAPL